MTAAPEIISDGDPAGQQAHPTHDDVRLSIDGVGRASSTRTLLQTKVLDPAEYETWHPVPGFEDSYSVSDKGRVRSEARPIKAERGACKGRILRWQDMRILRTTAGSSRYPQVTLCRDQRPHQRTVHELVLLAFVGPRPPGLECLHADDVKLNNALSNLSYGTHSQNACDAVRNGVHPLARRTHCANGHEFTLDNTWRRRSNPGTRVCRECRRTRDLLRRQEPHAKQYPITSSGSDVASPERPPPGPHHPPGRIPPPGHRQDLQEREQPPSEERGLNSRRIHSTHSSRQEGTTS